MYSIYYVKHYEDGLVETGSYLHCEFAELVEFLAELDSREVVKLKVTNCNGKTIYSYDLEDILSRR